MAARILLDPRPNPPGTPVEPTPLPPEPAVSEPVFFIGWSGRTGPALGRFLALVGAGAVAGLGLLGFTLGAGLDDPSAGLIGLAPVPQVAPLAPEGRRVEGVLEPGPYPILRLAPTPDRPQGEALLLNGFGKTGVAVDPALYGTRVAAQRHGVPPRRHRDADHGRRLHAPRRRRA